MKKQNKDILRKKGLELMNLWRADWNRFVREALGVTLDKEQQEILSSVQHNRRTSVASGTARGKDFVAACAAICFLYLTPRWRKNSLGEIELVENTKVALTAPTDRQVKNIMMPEISRLFNRAKARGVELIGKLNAYDIRTNNYSDIDQVISAQESYWYCKGDFHSHGDFIGKINYSSPYANCLVTPNNSINGNGSIIRYGIDGVCHQVSNQVLYRSKNPLNNLRVDKARGYKLSSLIFETYGLNKDMWQQNKINCLSNTFTKNQKSLLMIRANEFARKHNINMNIIKDLENRRLMLLTSLESEGTAIRGITESVNQRVEKMNLLIREYTITASNLINNDFYKYIFGIEPGVRIDIIDAEQFEFLN